MISPTLKTMLKLTLVLAVSFALLLMSDGMREERKSWPEEESYINLPEPQSARFRALGYNELLADLRWCQMLVYFGTSLSEDTNLRYMAKFIRNIIALDPKFKKLYRWATHAVTIEASGHISTEMEDLQLSLEIAERGMHEFPDDYEFPWIAGTTYFFDMKSSDPEKQRAFKERGAEFLEIAMNKPNAPKDLATKAASFRSQLGQKEQARANLMQKILTTDDPKAQAEMLRRFEYHADSELAEELAKATQLFSEERADYLPTVPADIFVLIGGPKRSSAIEFEELATSRALFGAEGFSEEVVLFPRR